MPPKGHKIPSAAKFRFVPAAKVPAVIFDNDGRGRVSAYLLALQHLLENPGQLLEVDSLTARGGINGQAKKHGIKVLFGEKDGKLYVRVLEQESPEACVLKALERGPLNMLELEAEVDKTHRGADVGKLIDALSSNSKIRLQTMAGTNAKKWHLVKAVAA